MPRRMFGINRIFICVLFLTECVLFITAKKLDISKAASDLLEKEMKRLKKEDKYSCSLKLISFYNLKIRRFRRMPNPKIDLLSCTVIYLQEHNPEDGWMWSVLGEIYLKKGGKFNTLANTCFKQAAKLFGKLSPFVKEWYFLGPFVIGKTEQDGDPVEFYGGIKNVSRFRDIQKEKYFSELAKNGVVHWKEISAEGILGDRPVKVTPKIDWNDLVSSLGSMGITEWQGWIVGEFAVNEKDVNVLVQCLGIHTLWIDDMMLTGDVYHRDKFWFSVPLTRGIHTIYIRLRTKVIQNFKCSLKLASSTFSVLPPPFLPDLVGGYLPSYFITIPISNFHSTKWLKDIRVAAISQSDNVIGSLKLRLLKDSGVSIAPGQTRPINIELEPSEQPITNGCSDVKLQIKISTSEGPTNLPITLRCRKPNESFLFTFVDHDGSIQHAAAIKPLTDCLYRTNTQTDVHTGKQIYPTLLTLHGTTVPAQNQADSYKHVRDKEFEFGVPGAWLLAPTRHGAHNWEGPGAMTAMTALEQLSDLTHNHGWIEQLASSTQVIFAGHSMGGHGAWHVATHFPDLALGLVSLAGWIKKEEYGDSNLFFKHDISTSHTDPAVKSVLEACIAENDADRFVSNLQGIPVMARIGSNDRTVHPFFTRRMYRRLKEERIEVTYTEIKDKEHWWWDTRETNDGGAVNDKQLRDFVERVACPLSKFEESGSDASTRQSCQVGEDCDENQQKNKYTTDSNLPPFENFTFSTMNPAFGGRMKGIKVLQQITPYRMSLIKGKCIQGEIILRTVNVARFSLREPEIRPVMWRNRSLKINGKFTVSEKTMKTVVDNENAHFCKIQGSWEVCEESLSSLPTRGPHNLGPARRIAESKFIIITGTQGTESSRDQLLNYAVYIANLFYLTADTFVPIIKDSETDAVLLDSTNVIILGNTEENLLTSQFLTTVPINMEKGGLSLESCHFDDARTGLMTLTPNGDLHLAMVLMGLGVEGMKDVISLATPTIPPMTRSPFSNLLPDFVVTGPEFGAKGPGGFLCAGFWGNQWEYRSDLSSCVC